MFSLIAGRSRAPAPELSHCGAVSSMNLVKIVSRKLTRHISGLVRFAKVVGLPPPLPVGLLHLYQALQ